MLPTDLSAQASQNLLTGKKDSYTACLSQKQTKICSTLSFSKMPQKSNASTSSPKDPKNQPKQFTSRSTGQYPTESPSSPSASQSRLTTPAHTTAKNAGGSATPKTTAPAATTNVGTAGNPTTRQPSAHKSASTAPAQITPQIPNSAHHTKNYKPISNLPSTTI